MRTSVRYFVAAISAWSAFGALTPLSLASEIPTTVDRQPAVLGPATEEPTGDNAQLYIDVERIRLEQSATQDVDPEMPTWDGDPNDNPA